MRATPQAIADHRQARARGGDRQPGILARQPHLKVGRAANTGGHEADHYRSHPPFGSATEAATFGFVLRERADTLMVTSWKNLRI